MAKFPLIEFNRHDGASVMMRLPDSVDLWEYLAWHERVFMGITDERLAKSRAQDAAMAQQLARGKKR